MSDYQPPVAVPNDLPTILGEIDSIERDMRFDRASYNRDVTKQDRYRQLVARKMGYSGSQDTILGEGIQIAGQQEYAAVHGTVAGYNDYLRLARESSDVLFGIPAGEQAEFVGSIDRLPDSVTDVMFVELMSKSGHAGYSSPESVGFFASLPEGAVLVREWGGDAPTKHALVKARLLRAADAMETDDDAELFLDWHDRLSTGAKIALYRKLAA